MVFKSYGAAIAHKWLGLRDSVPYGLIGEKWLDLRDSVPYAVIG
jgi:hypothetical protein